MELVHQEFSIQNKHQERDGSIELESLSNGIRLEGVHFRYEQQLDDVINGVSLEISVRTTVALVGESGSGKSTLVDLLTLIHKPYSGHILIDGVQGEEIRLSSWRNKIGYVSQETVVLTILLPTISACGQVM
ncbi:ATP-binding cassette domain-containing protein [Candidatus Reidiella endopervernicosa]|uniref:ATP-binding cassette domain-containing protein n=1 Tax=Candidatus Reidiella endopervernicosa TaxID=2738883 RepID=UPI0023512F07|nr:ATP-binding cassette domain-containing protein [Candidatus Reidiella endopervernicosa]